jgi:hypothetical protein
MKKIFDPDLLATIFGAIAGIAQLLVATNKVNTDDGQLIAGLALIALGIVSNKKPSQHRAGN